MPAVGLLLVAGTLVGSLCFNLFLLTFPNGRFAPRWVRFIFPVLALYGGLTTVRSIPVVAATHFGVAVQSLQFVFLFILYGTISSSHIYRYRHVSTVVERQQTKWVVFGIVVGLIWALMLGLYVFWVDPTMLHGALQKVLGIGLLYAGYLLIPLSIGVAIMRSQLWDIDLIISRTLVYGTLTALVVGIYIGIVGYLAVCRREPLSCSGHLCYTGTYE